MLSDPLLPLLVPELPEQQERDEYEREGQQDVGLDNVQEVEDQRDRSGHDTGDGVPVVAPQPVFLDGMGHPSVCAVPFTVSSASRRRAHAAAPSQMASDVLNRDQQLDVRAPGFVRWTPVRQSGRLTRRP